MSKLKIFDNYINSFGLKGLNNQIYGKGFLRGADQNQVYSIDIEGSLFNVTEDVKVPVLTTKEDEKKNKKDISKYSENQRNIDDLKTFMENEKLYKQAHLGYSLKLKKKIYKGSLEWQKTKPALFSRHIVKNQFFLLNNLYAVFKLLQKTRYLDQNLISRSALALKEQRGGFVLSYFGTRGFMPTNHFNTLVLFSISSNILEHTFSYQFIFRFFKTKNIFRIYFYNFEVLKRVRFVKNAFNQNIFVKKNKRALIELENWDKIWIKKRKKILRKRERKVNVYKSSRLKFYIIFYLNKNILKLTKKLLKLNTIFFRKKKHNYNSSNLPSLFKRNKSDNKRFIKLSNKYYLKKE